MDIGGVAINRCSGATKVNLPRPFDNPATGKAFTHRLFNIARLVSPEERVLVCRWEKLIDFGRRDPTAPVGFSQKILAPPGF